jgi:hypothetical protein
VEVAESEDAVREHRFYESPVLQASAEIVFGQAANKFLKIMAKVTV